MSLPTGEYFLLANMDTPVPTQIQFWANVAVNGGTGHFVGAFANADRNGDVTRCTPACAATEACQTIPSQSCVLPSAKGASPDEYPDWIVNTKPPRGYVFTIEGCARAAQSDLIHFTTAPMTMVFQQPALTLVDLVMTGDFSVDAAGVTRLTGTFESTDVLLGTVSSGPASGTLVGRHVALSDSPAPPTLPDAPATP